MLLSTTIWLRPKQFTVKLVSLGDQGWNVSLYQTGRLMSDINIFVDNADCARALAMAAANISGEPLTVDLESAA